MEAKKQPIEITLSPKEREYYEYAFSTVATNEAEGKVVKNANLKSLFRTSEIQAKELAAIWNLTADKKNKLMHQQAFFTALKLIALKQNGKSLDDWKTECMIEQPLPRFGCKELVTLKAQLEEPVEKPTDEMIIKIIDTEYVKLGYFGVSSYTAYRIETRSKINGFDPRAPYVVLRRFSDFAWLQSKLETKEKYKGCVYPLLPSKKYFGKNAEEFVEKRRQDLQLYLQMLARHTLLKYDETFKVFLTCEDPEAFERYKQDPSSTAQPSSIPLSSLKKLQFHDTINYIYSSIKTKLFDRPEPQEFQIGSKLDEITERISQYLPFLEKSITALKENVDFSKHCIASQEGIIKSLQDIVDADMELDKTFQTVAEFHSKYTALLMNTSKLDLQLLDELKQERLNLESIKQTIAQRKQHVDTYNTLSEYVKGKTEKLGIETPIAGGEDGLKLEMDKVKDQIMKFNSSLSTEFENYTKHRNENKEKAKKMKDFAKDQQKNFPLYDFASDFEASPLLSFKKEESKVNGFESESHTKP